MDDGQGDAGGEGEGEGEGAGEAAAPGPLFAALPRPAVAYDDGEPPTVRAVNAAYREHIGEGVVAPGDDLSAALAEGQPTDESGSALVGPLGASSRSDLGRVTAVGAVRATYRLETVSLSGANADGVLLFEPVASGSAATDEHLRTFARVVSHDLRNPLEVATIRLDAAEHTGEAEHFETVRWALERIERLASDVLFLTDPTAAIDPDPVDLSTAAETAWEPLSTEAATLDVDAGLPTIRADPDALGRLLSNLFRNAVEHAGPDVSVRLEDRPDGFAVTDDGPGVSAAVRERAFEPGVSGDEGTGLGLAVVDRVARAHGWSVELAGEPGEGTSVVVRGVESVAPSEPGE